MKMKISYEIVGATKTLEIRTIKEVDKEIKKFIDRAESFEVRAVISYDYTSRQYKRRFGNVYCPGKISFEFWEYCAETNKVFSFNLRKNMYYKRMMHMTKRLRPTMKNYGI